MNRVVTLSQFPSGSVQLSIERVFNSGAKRRTTLTMTPDMALHLSNRLQSYARGQHTTTETIFDWSNN